MKSPLFSIIIPVFNTEKYIEDALKSIRLQSFSDYEVIAINDASTDSSLEIIQNYQLQDERIKVIDLKKNKGQGYGRNLALKKAKGDYILFLEADDYFDRKALTKLDQSIKKKSHTEVFVWGYSSFQEGKKSKKTRIPRKPNKRLGENPLTLGMLDRKGFLAVPWVYIIKKSLIEKHGFCFSEGIYFEDIEFTTSLLFYTKRISVLPFVGYHYRNHPLSVTGFSSKQKIEDKFDAFNRIKLFMIEKNIFHDYQPLYLVRLLAFGVFTCFGEYFSLPKREINKQLYSFMKDLRKSNLLSKENLLLVRNVGLSIDKETESQIRRFYLNAYASLKAIKYRYILYSSLSRFLIWCRS